MQILSKQGKRLQILLFRSVQKQEVWKIRHDATMLLRRISITRSACDTMGSAVVSIFQLMYRKTTIPLPGEKLHQNMKKGR